MKQLNNRYNELICEIGRLFMTSKDMNLLLFNVIELCARYIPIERAMINIHDLSTDEIFIDVSYGYSDDEVKKGRYKVGEGIIGTVISTGETLIVPSIHDEPRFLNRTGARKDEVQKDISFICIPIKIAGETIGTISIDINLDDQNSLFEEIQLLNTLAVITAHAVKVRRDMLQMERELRAENEILKNKIYAIESPRNIIGSSRVMKELYEKIVMVAGTDSTVLILGESGTGKELIAEAIHHNSNRKDRPLIKVNIAALPHDLIESELFGYERGAFTGAFSQKKGKFESADGGTIFLDEIGDLNSHLQINLLRVLQEKTIERLGSTETLPLDVRIVAATHQDLEKKIKKNEFRSDLYYRLNVFPIFAPPLRERKADIILLADYFLEKYNSKINKKIKRISSDAIDMLSNYHWPGNVRELENCIERAVIVSNEKVIRNYHLPPSLQMAEGGTEQPRTLEEMTNLFVKEIIIDHLKVTKGNIAQAARMLGSTKRILAYKINKLGVDYHKYKN
ncbi:MAG: sigma 54-interacting transcriptional regulator [Spirochaetota bacterium]|nr:sigma 54-interacting transcriptional regulator [Spirochaetota bacterium]